MITLIYQVTKWHGRGAAKASWANIGEMRRLLRLFGWRGEMKNCKSLMVGGQIKLICELTRTNICFYVPTNWFLHINFSFPRKPLLHVPLKFEHFLSEFSKGNLVSFCANWISFCLKGLFVYNTNNLRYGSTIEYFIQKLFFIVTS